MRSESNAESGNSPSHLGSTFCRFIHDPATGDLKELAEETLPSVDGYATRFVKRRRCRKRVWLFRRQWRWRLRLWQKQNLRGGDLATFLVSAAVLLLTAATLRYIVPQSAELYLEREHEVTPDDLIFYLYDETHAGHHDRDHGGGDAGWCATPPGADGEGPGSRARDRGVIGRQRRTYEAQGGEIGASARIATCPRGRGVEVDRLLPSFSRMARSSEWPEAP